MKKYYVIIIFLSLLSSCTTFSSNTKFTPADGFQKVEFSTRPVPATITKEPDQTLKEKGYIRIGSVRLEDDFKSCWDKECQNFECTYNQPHKDMIKEVLERATAQGGDLLILESNAKGELLRTEKEDGPCVRYGDKYIQVSYCCKQGKGYCESTCYKTEKRTVCMERTTVYGKKCAFVTSGNVWRHEPELIKYFQFNRDYHKYFRDKYWPKEATEPGIALENAKLGFKDTSGKMIIASQFSQVSNRWYEGLRAACIVKLKDEKCGFIDKTGKWIIQPYFDVRPGSFHEGLAAVSVNNKWGFIDRQGKYVINPQYMAVNFDGFSEGLVAVKMDKKWGYVDKKGSFIIKPQFTNAYAFSEGLAAVEIDGKWGYIDKQGKIIIIPQFDISLHFVKDIAKVRVGNNWKLINKTGEVIGADLSRPFNDYYLTEFDPDEYSRRLGEGLQRGLDKWR
jgi:hypothetical protein